MSVDLGIVGLGYVGLPLARQATAAGLSVLGFDIAPSVVTGLNSGRSHVHDVSAQDLAAMRAAGFTVHDDAASLATVDTVVICVPTGLGDDGRPDLRAVRRAGEAVACRLRPGMLVVLESTSYPGTTDEVLRPILEQGSGLLAGVDFHLAFSPERIDPGNRRFGVRNTPKIVSGYTPVCTKYCATFYSRFVDSVVVARGTREAELAKLLENTYRYVNIALVNEMAVFCDRLGVDIWDVLYCAGTKPFGFASFRPGPGVGGHCIPIDPLYLSSKADSEGFTFRMLSAAREINDRMPSYVVERAVGMLSARGVEIAGANVLLLGVTYKPDVPDVRESPAFGVANGLQALGARVTYHDPHVPELAIAGTTLRSVGDLVAALRGADLAVLLQDHACYQNLAGRCSSLLDTRGNVAGHRVEPL